MPRRYPVEFRRKVLDLIEAGKPVAEIAAQLGITAQTIYNSSVGNWGPGRRETKAGHVPTSAEPPSGSTPVRSERQHDRTSAHTISHLPVEFHHLPARFPYSDMT